MANRIQPHPNPPYLLSDGSLNVSGQIKLFAAGTTTPKIAYKDIGGTSYGSVIDLNASGLPTDGPIYWDTSALYKVEVYTRVDDTPTYALDYTVDNFGVTDSSATQRISSATVWVVDGVGASSTTFATLKEAYEEARNYIIMGGGGLTIQMTVTTIDDVVDFSHPQGQYISIVGVGAAGLQYDTVAAPVVSLKNGGVIGNLSNLIFVQNTTTSGGTTVIRVEDHSTILEMSGCALSGDGTTPNGLLVMEGSSVGSLTSDIDVLRTAQYGVQVDGDSTVEFSTINISNAIDGGGIAGVVVSGTRGSLRTVNLLITGKTGSKITYGVRCENRGAVYITSIATLEELTTGFSVITGGRIYIDDAGPAFTAVTTNYSTPVNVLTTTTLSVGNLIRQA